MYKLINIGLIDEMFEDPCLSLLNDIRSCFYLRNHSVWHKTLSV